MTSITLIINGYTHPTSITNLAELLATLNPGDMFAVARNGEFVPKSQHATTTLAEGDALDVVTPVGGG